MKLNNRLIKQSLRMSFLMALSLLSTSCEDWVYDDLSDCKMYLKFRYDYNMLRTDAFPQQVEEVNVFFFDAQGKYVMQQSASGSALKQADYKMELQLPAGQSYTAVTWAGHLDDYALTTLTAGVSTAQDLQLRLASYDAATATCDRTIQELWHGSPVQFDRIIGSQTVEIPLVKNTNHVRFVMRDINADEQKYQPVSDFDIKVSAANTAYDYRHELLTSPTIDYKPYYTAGDSYTGMVAELNTMRLVADRAYTFDISDRATGISIFGNSDIGNDLIHWLLLTKMEAYHLDDQEYLDREYDWKVIIFYSYDAATSRYLAVKIVINDWTIWTQDVVVGD